MSKNKNKVKKLTEAQYNEYIANLRMDAALYKADGSRCVPPEIDIRDGDNENEKGE